MNRESKRFIAIIACAVFAFVELSACAPTVSPTFEMASSPDGGATEAVEHLIGEAKKSIRVAAYSFTSKEIATALVDASKRGVDVKVLLDKSNAHDKHTVAILLADAGVPIRIDYKYAIMHSKFIVVDGMTVETGSFNYTRAAEHKNAENLIIIRKYPDIAYRYSHLWQRLWDESREYKARD